MKIKVIDPILHDGELLQPGAYVDMKDAAAKQLIASGAATAAGKAKDTATAAQAKSDEPAVNPDEPAQ